MFAKLMLPFALPIVLTFVLVFTVGERWPRNIAPGSGLKLAGMLVAALTSVIIWNLVARSIEDHRARSFGALLCAVTGLLGWPVWSVGVLPSVNGFKLGEPQTISMTLERTEVTPVKQSSRFNHWAWLKTDRLDLPIASGRYFISKQTYDDWSRRESGPVKITFARGLLGAQVVIGYK